MTDPLSDVFRAVRLIGGVFIDARFTAPWCIAGKISPNDCRAFLAEPTQVISYHVVIEGRLLLFIEGEPAIEVRAGEVILLPRNDLHIMGSALGLEPLSAANLIKPSSDGGLAQISHGGGGEAAHLVCGFLATDASYNPLIETLPRLLTIDVRQGTSRDWIEASVQFAASELAEGRLASSSVMSRLSETLLVEAVRHYSSTHPGGETGWLKGLKDPYVGRALVLIHRNISAPWSADTLASEVALSRSAFMDRFRTLVGMPPIRYLTVWRLQTAKLQLRESTNTISQIAHSIGYKSEEAFSRAFKREFGVAPTQWKERNSGPAASA